MIDIEALVLQEPTTMVGYGKGRDSMEPVSAKLVSYLQATEAGQAQGNV